MYIYIHILLQALNTDVMGEHSAYAVKLQCSTRHPLLLPLRIVDGMASSNRGGCVCGTADLARPETVAMEVQRGVKNMHMVRWDRT